MTRVLLISLLFLIVGFNSFSQEDSSKVSYAAGIGIPYLPYTVNKEFPFSYYNVSFLINYKKNIIRTGATYCHRKFTHTKANDLLINLGYERGLFKGRFKLIYGADLCYYQITTKKITNNVVISDMLITPVILQFGSGPILGAQCSISKKLKIRTESGFFVGYSFFKPENASQLIRDGLVYTAHRFLSLSINYSF